MLYISNMDFRNTIYSRGLKVSWISKQIDVNYNSLRVYLNNPSLMPTDVEDKLKEFLN